MKKQTGSKSTPKVDTKAQKDKKAIQAKVAEKKEKATKPAKTESQMVSLEDQDKEIAEELARVEAELAQLEKEPPAEEPAAEEGKPKKERKAKKDRQEKRDTGDVVTAKELASDLGVEARILRRTLRKLAKDKAITDKDGRWEWTPGHADIATITAALAKADKAE